jgi:hypothetical protein
MEHTEIVTLVAQLLGGAVGSIIIGALLSGLSLGTFGNMVAGLIGGGAGGRLLTTVLALEPAGITAGMDPMAVVAHAAAGAVGGVITLIVIAILRALFAK